MNGNPGYHGYMIPSPVIEFAEREYEIALAPRLDWPRIPHGHETGGIIVVDGGSIKLVELPNDSPLSHYNHYHPQLEVYTEPLPVLGVWHTHWNDVPPSALDARAAKIWATEDGVPLFVVFSDTKSWWFADGALIAATGAPALSSRHCRATTPIHCDLRCGA